MLLIVFRKKTVDEDNVKMLLIVFRKKRWMRTILRCY